MNSETLIRTAQLCSMLVRAVQNWSELISIDQKSWCWSVLIVETLIRTCGGERSTAPMLYICIVFHFLAIFIAMKYLLKAPGIHMKSTMKYPRNKNKISIEIPQVSIWKVQWNISWNPPGIYIESSGGECENWNEISTAEQWKQWG